MVWWSKAVWIALGGALGALGRTGLSEGIAVWCGGRSWVGTLVVNLIGCFVMGMAKGAVSALDWGSPEVRILLFAGVLGAFTTFSTFEADAVVLGERSVARAALYVAVSVAGGLAAFGAGWWVTTRSTL